MYSIAQFRASQEAERNDLLQVIKTTVKFRLIIVINSVVSHVYICLLSQRVCVVATSHRGFRPNMQICERMRATSSVWQKNVNKTNSRMSVQ